MAWPTRILIAIAALAAQHVVAQSNRGSDFLRFACSQLVVERTDPLVNPGQKPTPHMHQIVGGSSFNITVGQRRDPGCYVSRGCQYGQND